jgi:hypothetical protein
MACEAKIGFALFEGKKAFAFVSKVAGSINKANIGKKMYYVKTVCKNNRKK